jgi:poly(beta-D-mannuronate) C5 epimerase
VINNKRVLLESYPKPVVIFYHGNLYAKNSTFLTWNLKTNSFDVREYIPEKNLLLIGKQRPRPYFIGMTGSKTYFVNNYFNGLGYHSTTAPFGIAIIHFSKDLIIQRFRLFSYLNKKGKPVGYYVGNTMVNNMMGFYCSDAKDTVIIGNLMYDNLIYNIDPHDYSENLIIARNITARAKHAHGIVISRQVDYSTIAQNLTFNNHSAGIMLDRLSNHNFIYDNLSILNGFMGISVQESDDVLIYKNKIYGNKIDGVIIRNSLKNSVIGNDIKLNLKNGIEVLTKNIDNISYRNFARDPYHKATSAFIENNRIINNLFYNITVKNNAAIEIKNNFLRSKYFPNFGGDLNVFLPKINENKGNFKLYGIGNPFRPISIDKIEMSKYVAKKAAEILVDASCYNDYISYILAKIYLKKFKNKILAKQQYIRGISQLSNNDMFSYGYFLITYAKNKNDYINGLSYLAQSAIFNNESAIIDLSQINYLLPVKKEDINKAFKMAIDRLKRYKLVEDEYNVSCPLTEEKKAKIESALKLFIYKYNNSHAKNFYDYCKMTLKDYNIFTPDVIQKVRWIFAKANVPKKEYHKKLLRENEIIKDAPGCKLVTLRRKRIEESINSYFKENKNYILKHIEPEIKRYLKMINDFRINKVSEKRIYKLLEGK